MEARAPGRLRVQRLDGADGQLAHARPGEHPLHDQRAAEQVPERQPDHGEQALEIVEVLIRSNSVDVVVVDSVAALVPKAEIEGEMGEAQMGLQARLMSQALRKLTGVVSKSKTTKLSGTIETSAGAEVCLTAMSAHQSAASTTAKMTHSIQPPKEFQRACPLYYSPTWLDT